MRFNFKNLYLRSTFFAYLNKLVLFASGFLYTFFIANYLGPEDYGLVMYLFSFVGNMVLLFGTESFQDIITVFTAKTRSWKIFHSVLLVQALISITIFAIFVGGADVIVSFLGRGTPELFRVISLMVLFTPFSIIALAMFRGFKSFGKVLKIGVLENLSNLVLAFVLLTYFQAGLMGIVAAKIFSLAISLVVGIYYLKKMPFEKKETGFAEVKKYSRAAIPFNFIKKAKIQVELILVGLFIYNTTLGFFFIAEKFMRYAMQMPLSAITETVAPFAYEKHKDKKALGEFISMNLKAMVLLSLLFGIVSIILSVTIFDFFFPEYSWAKTLVPVFILLYAFEVNVSLGSVFRALNKVEFLFKVSVLQLALTVFLGYFLIANYALNGYLFLMVLSKALGFVIYTWKIRKLGVSLTFIPGKKDLAYFYNSFKGVVFGKS